MLGDVSSVLVLYLMCFCNFKFNITNVDTASLQKNGLNVP